MTIAKRMLNELSQKERQIVARQSKTKLIYNDNNDSNIMNEELYILKEKMNSEKTEIFINCKQGQVPS